MTPLSTLFVFLSLLFQAFTQVPENSLLAYGTCDKGLFEGNPNDCSTYFQCNFGQKLLRDCPPTLHWNTEITACDWPRNVRSGACLDKSLSNKPNNLNFGLENEDTAVIQETCQEGAFIQNMEDCSSYLICNHGVLMSQPCGAGLHWNSVLNTCDWPENAQCTSSQPSDPSHANPSSEDHFPSEDVTDVEAPVDETSDLSQPEQPPLVQIIPEAEEVIPQPIEPWTSNKKLICYFTDWAWYRPSSGKYMPEDIDPNLCTHVMYAFALLGYDNTIKPADSWADYDNHFYEKVTSLKSKGIKVLLALGGWNDSGGSKYSRLVNDPKSRATFTKSAIEYIMKYNFDGLDLDWEYPKCWQGNCPQGPDSDKKGFTDLVRELRAALPSGYLLTAAVSANPLIIDAGYDVPALNRLLDHIGVMTYDYHGSWDKSTGHVSPLYYTPGDVQPEFNSNSSIHAWISRGASPDKLLMGIPAYAQSFTLASTSQRGFNSPVTGPGQAGTYTRQGGILAYYEVCTAVKKSWTIVQDPNGCMGPYAYSGNQWISYDDVSMVTKKAEYIIEQNLGGGMVWAPDLDDFKNICGNGRYPITKAISSVLRK